MKIAISGASGKTGFRVAEEALAAGYEVKLLIRKQSQLPKQLENCEKVIVSLNQEKELDKALEGIDVLVIATGARPSIDLTGPAKIDALGVKQQVNSCKRKEVNRVILISSLCTGRFFHPLNLFGLILVWKRVGERILQNSNLDWTIIRPGGLNENEESLDNENINYTEENTQEKGYIPRRLVAKACIEAINTNISISKIIEVTSGKDFKRINMQKAIEAFSV